MIINTIPHYIWLHNMAIKKLLNYYWIMELIAQLEIILISMLMTLAWINKPKTFLKREDYIQIIKKSLLEEYIIEMIT